MRIVILGAGVVGVCTAWYLARDGHEVVVLDRNPEAGAEATWGNAGLIAPSQAYSMASPRIWRMVRQSVFTKSGPLKFRMPPERALVPWMLKFLPHCTGAKARELTRKKFLLSMHSLAEFHEIVAQTGIRFNDHISGSTNIFRDDATLRSAWEASEVLREEGLELERLDRDALVGVEPCLGNLGDQLTGGLRSRIDWTGDPALFTRRLLQWLQDKHGVTPLFGKKINALHVDAGRIRHVEVEGGTCSGDAFVLALGSHSAELARTVGVRLPIYPVKGYSVTAPIGTADPRMTGSIIDSSRRLALTRIGSSIRVTFKAEFVGHDATIDRSVFRLPLEYLRGLFPGSLDYDAAHYWSGFRPMTPSGLPIIGRTSYENLYLNTGHGHLGWTMGPGTGKLLSDLIAGREPDLDLAQVTERIK